MKTVKSIVFGSSLILGCLAAHAQFTGIGGAYNYAVLLGNNVNNSSVNGSVTGNVGAGSGTGVSVPSGGLIGGSLFLEGSSNPGANVNGTVTGSTTYNNAGIATIINDLNQLSSAYNSYSGVASLAINANSSGSVQTVAASSGTFENNSTFGSAYVYDVSSVDLANGGTLQISGSSNTRVVLNVDSQNAEFNGNISLTGGITAQDVIVNIVGGEFQNTAGTVQDVTYLGENISGGFNIEGTVDGPVFVMGAGSFQVNSGGSVVSLVAAPEPGTWAGGAFLLLPIGVSVWRRVKGAKAARTAA